MRFPAFLLLLCATGYAAGAVRTWSVEAPAISRKIGPVTVTGRVVTVDPLRHGARAVLDDLAIGRLAAAETPERVRLTVRLGWTGLRPGRTVMLRAVLLPVRPPVAPGAADFQRRAFFERIGASGFAVTAPIAVREADAGWLDSRIERLRDTAMRRIGAVLSGDAGAVATALLTGHRGGISPETMAAIRNAGLAHLLAISGLHIGMIAGIAFFALWFGLALVPGAALRWPTRKIAAIGALAVAAAYLLLTGATIPTQRAFLMLAVVMVGVLAGRVAISMRLVAAAATVLLLLSPESLPTPSFQMSFAAVVALVAAYEAWSAWRLRAAGAAAPPSCTHPGRRRCDEPDCRRGDSAVCPVPFPPAGDVRPRRKPDRRTGRFRVRPANGVVGPVRHAVRAGGRTALANGPGHRPDAVGRSRRFRPSRCAGIGASAAGLGHGADRRWRPLAHDLAASLAFRR